MIVRIDLFDDGLHVPVRKEGIILADLPIVNLHGDTRLLLSQLQVLEGLPHQRCTATVVYPELGSSGTVLAKTGWWQT